MKMGICTGLPSYTQCLQEQWRIVGLSKYIVSEKFYADISKEVVRLTILPIFFFIL